MFSTCPFVCTSVRPSVRSLIHYQPCEHDTLKTDEWSLLQIGTIDLPVNENQSVY